ncbi:ABC transporter substrate-binding protein [Nocardia sp. NPDC127579]|uniref:ABC transporter substrate-binding protein n=1 Tax=Nocardia sp. NPDC127579 TaxID=3345402 RepID=UPI0036266446
MPRPVHRLLTALLTAALLVLGLTACIATPDSAASGATIRIGTLRGQPHLYAPYFMQRFAPDDKFEIVLFNSSPDIKNALASGAVDFGVLGAPSTLSAIAAGQRLKIVASAADGGSGFVGRPEITDVAALRGKKIGFPAGSSQEIALRLTLGAHGLDPETDVELVNLEYSDMVNAYTSGRIDAFLSAETGVSIALRSGAHRIVSPYDTPIGAVNIVFATREQLIEQDRDRVRRTVDSFVKAIGHMRGDRAAWAQGLVDTFGVDRAVTETAIDNVTLRYALDEEYRRRVGALAAQMVAFDQLAQAPDMTTVFDAGFLPGGAP